MTIRTYEALLLTAYVAWVMWICWFSPQAREKRWRRAKHRKGCPLRYDDNDWGVPCPGCAVEKRQNKHSR